MDKELNYFRQLILWLYEQHVGEYVNPSARVQAILDGIPPAYQRFSDSGVLENALPSDEQPIADFKDLGKFLFLKPTDKGGLTIPILSVKSDFTRSLPEVRIRLVLFLLDVEHENKVCSLGYRFETPEGSGGGRHDYYHAQPIKNVFLDKPGFILNCPAWFPDAYPTWPMDAKNPVTLCLNILFSIYGLTYSQELIRSELGNILKGHLDCTHCLNLPKPSFWQVTFKGTKKHFKTWHKHAAFDKFCASKIGARYTKREIFAAEYYALAENKQFVC